MRKVTNPSLVELPTHMGKTQYSLDYYLVVYLFWNVRESMPPC